MAGHSKWSNIKHRKGKQDAMRGKIFMKMAKELYVAAKNGGADPEMNPALRVAIEKAKAANLPNDNIDRAINKAVGNQDDTHYDEVIYEGYGPGGVAVMVNCLTDNRNRTASNVRHAFTKYGGNLGESGCVAYMFDRKGYLVIAREGLELDEDDMLLQVLEAGGDDLETNEEVFEIFTEVDSFISVKEALEAEGFKFIEAEITMLPQTYTELSGEQRENMEKMLDLLEEDEDVQDVYSNYE